MFNQRLPYSRVQRNRLEASGKPVRWLWEDIYKFFAASPSSRRKYLVEIRRYPGSLYTADFYAKTPGSPDRYRLRTNQFVLGAIGGTVLDIMARVLREDPAACFGFIAAALPHEHEEANTKRFRVYRAMLERTVRPTTYKLLTDEQRSRIFVLPAAKAADLTWRDAVILEYERIFAENY